jgi:4-hydroxy 2-oxovalerate aldolase
MTAMIPDIIDVTLRDGGYVNNFAFSLESAQKIVSTMPKVGVSRVEVGYYRPRLSADPAIPGPKCCRRDYLNGVSRVGEGVDIFVMVHCDDVQLDDYQLLADCGVRGVRLIVSSSEISAIEPHIGAIHATGLLCSVNLIRMSQRTLESMIVHARAAEQSGADWVYLADSNGSMFPDRVEEIFRRIGCEVRINLGFHAHDSLRLAFANALAAVRGGARLLDCSLGGMGKGAGNLATEIITGYLKSSYSVPYNLIGMVDVANDVVSKWIARDHEKRCESALSAFLDLNLDQLQEAVAAAQEQQCSLLAELDRRIDNRVSTQ